jgi:hypothetical protein
LVSLKQARDQLVDAKRLLGSGINPSTHKKILKNADKAEAENSFETAAREWFGLEKVGKKESYSSRIWGKVDKEPSPFLADRPISAINAPEL